MSIRSREPNDNPSVQSASQGSESRSQTSLHRDHHVLLRVTALIRKGDYGRAAALLSAGGHGSQTRNALGVCWMRAGAIEEAVQVYRALVLLPNSVHERFELPDVYKRNFATALLLKGRPSGALDVLNGTRDPDHVAAVRIRAAIQAWAKTLPFFRRLDWRINRVEPANCHVPIDFEPGEFDFDVAGAQPRRPVDGTTDAAA